MHFSRAEDITSHHVANAAAIGIPAGSWAVHAPEYLTTAVAIAGLIWYFILIGEWVAKKRRQWHVVKTVTTTHTVKTDLAVQPGAPKP